MKKFLVFCVAIIVTVSLGFMVYYFTRNNEGVTTPETVFNLNVGDVRAFELTHINPKDDTKISFVYEKEGIVEFDLENLTITALAGGSTRVTLQTTNKDIPVTYIEVNVGNGTNENPFYIRDEDELKRVGQKDTVYKLSSSYKLVNDVELSSTEWAPIGVTKEGGSEVVDSFTGTFDGNNKTISNVIVSNSNYAGLFGRIGEAGLVTNLNVVNVDITGSSAYAGSIAAVNNGTIKNCAVGTSNIASTNDDAKLGGIAGANESNNAIASIYKCSTNSTIDGVSGSNIGGITGLNKGAEVVYCYADTDSKLIAASTTVAGGLVGLNTYSSKFASIVAGSYSIGTLEGGANNVHGGVVGFNDYVATTTTEKTNKIYGNYYLSSGYGKGIGNYADAVNASSEPADMDFGVYGCEGKSYTELTTKSTFKLLKEANTGAEILWNFANVWSMGDKGTPRLNIDGSFVPSYRSSLIKAGSINQDTVNKLSQIKSGDVVEIGSDIDLEGATWDPLDVANVTILGSEEFYEENGRYPIISNFKLASKLIDGVNYVSFIANLDNSIIRNVNFANVSTLTSNYTQGNTIQMGVVAGKVKGNSLIENVGVANVDLKANVSSNLANGNIYIGAITGTNNGSIDEANVNGGNIKVTYDSEVKADSYVGGVAGAMLEGSASITNSIVDGISIDVANTGNGAIGGVVGGEYASTKVDNCEVRDVVIVSSISYTESSTDGLVGHYEGGIAGESKNNSIISSCIVDNTTITGFVIGGIVGSTSSLVENCYANINLTGFKVGGVAGYQINKSVIRHIRVDGELKNTNISFDLGQVHDENAEKAGIACISYGNSNEIPTFKNVFVNCTFANDGASAYKTTATIKDNNVMNRLGVKWIYSGEEESIVVNSDKTKNAKTNEKAGSVIDSIANFFGGADSFDIYEISNNDIANSNFKVFTSNGFNIENWTFENGKAPQVKPIKPVTNLIDIID